MSDHSQEQPVVRPRRTLNRPVYLTDYDLTGLQSLRHLSRPDRNWEDEAQHTSDPTGYSTPVSQAPSLNECLITDQWENTVGDMAQEHVESPKQKNPLSDLTAIWQEMKREHDVLRQQTSHFPELLSAFQEMRRENAILHREVKELRLEMRTSPHRLTHPVPSPRLHATAGRTNPNADLFCPIPAPRHSLAQHKVHSAPIDSTERITQQMGQIDFSPRHRSLQYDHPSNQFQPSPSNNKCYDIHNVQAQNHPPQHHTGPCKQEKTYRGPTPTIPNLSSPDPREFSRLRIALENILPEDATERFKFQILADHLKLEEALLVADSYSNSPYPFSNTMSALNKMYGQPHQLALQHIAEVMDGPDIGSGDVKSFRMFALRVRSLVSMLEQLGRKGNVELECGSHVTRLQSKLPHDLRSGFKRYIHPLGVSVPTLLDLAEWLEYELQVQEDSIKFSSHTHRDSSSRRREVRKDIKQTSKLTSILLNTERSSASKTTAFEIQDKSADQKVKPYCPYCDNSNHFLNSCANFKQLTRDQKENWIRTNNGCWRCGRGHQAAKCTLKAPCKMCNRRHLAVLHDVNERAEAKANPVENSCLVSTASEVLYVDRPTYNRKVLLKVSKVVLSNGDRSMEAYAVLDDGSERTIILHTAAKKLGLKGQPEDLVLRTVRQDLQVLHEAAVSFMVSPVAEPKRKFKIQSAFTAEPLGLAEHSHPVALLQRRYRHLLGLPLQQLDKVSPVLLIGSDCPHLITPIEPVRLGPPGGPAAVKTRLGWTLQGPARELRDNLTPQQCLFTSMSPCADLHTHVEKLWQMDVFPYRSEKAVTRSKQDHEAVQLLQEKTVRVEVNGIKRYATPLLRTRNMAHLRASEDATLPQLRSIERKLAKDSNQAAAYQAEIDKLEQSGYIVKLCPKQVEQSDEAWYVPHHMVQHNGKNRVVFNCSFQYKGHNLNQMLLPGPTLSPPLLAVLLRFREHTIAISSDIRSMFHQVCLLPQDRALVRFLWRDLKRENPPSVYEWRVLPFGTTCSPCCAVFALQKHAAECSQAGEAVQHSVEKSFYVDNCLQSFSSTESARDMVDKLLITLRVGGFELRQWASNEPSVIRHLPPEIRSESSELWLSEGHQDIPESTLGLHWNCQSDTLSYKHRRVDSSVVTMRTIYKILASQYDPLGYIVPYTTRAKLLVQRLWDKKRGWDDPQLPEELLTAWRRWEAELDDLQSIHIPRCYTSPEMDHPSSVREIHVFCDASEQAYGSVAYLRTENHGKVEVAFLTARSRVAPKKQQSIPRLELCAALTGAQMSKVLKTELTLTIQHVVLWTDSTTVLTWLNSDSCHYKVFVGTRVAEIQDLTEADTWRYVRSCDNPADDVTRGKTLHELADNSRWIHGPPFLRQSPEHWPEPPSLTTNEQDSELRTSTFCGITTTTYLLQDPAQYQTFQKLIQATALLHHGTQDISSLSAEDYTNAEIAALRQVQLESFPTEVAHLKAGKPVSATSRLLALAPEFDHTSQLIRVGGRLRRGTLLEPEMVHPILLDPHHPITKLLIKDYDDQLHHPGSERLFSEVRRKFWILRGREAIRQHQRNCAECRKWRARPNPPRMADLPPARLRILKPAFYSTGVDCFGPYMIKIGRRSEKRWGILFKCLTTRAVHIDILTSIDMDAFLMALRRFIARRGKPFEVLCDQGTNFKGGERELKEAFNALHSDLQAQLAGHQIKFAFNPPGAPHFGGCWEREIRSVKSALQVTLGAQAVTEEVLRTLLIEVEGILNSKPLGYTSSDLADPDPVTPNILLMGRRDASLPQVVYQNSEMLGRRRWRHSQLLADHFWKHFIQYYLPSLQARQKWRTEKQDLQLEDTVMIIDPQLPRALWPVGRVTQVFPGADKRIRSADVQVKDRTYTRPVARLVSLPALPDDD
ncbi:uncharacterized protein LOC111189354 [Astyanax mexicanus]|uniref:uncharacterized protein LOC111189354 n=1 Tax=Astyanax mexicanus TaxID=7994 RepID=UPI0020CAC6DB|nr:uncharacterized protein LOC111189354 [Astyanax mexicanus]